MQRLTHLLKNATAAILPGFFKLNIHGGRPVYRERVYCYELYHQMRLLWPDDSLFSLNGEVDKAGHPDLSQLPARYAKPDLLIHQPGQMAGNFAIVEVKSAIARTRDIKKDIAKLSIFRRDVGYRRAIFLIYGEEIDDRLAKRLWTAATTVERLAPIDVWFHIAPGRPASHEFTLGR